MAAERLGEQAKRLRVWAEHKAIDAESLPIHLIGPGGALNDPGFARYIKAEARTLRTETGMDEVLVIIDTAGAVMPGQDLNNPGVGTIFAHHVRVILSDGATVAVVHHTPKSGDATGMGSQQIDGLFDATVHVEATANGATVTQTKGNTVVNWLQPLAWTGEVVTVELDGETVSAWMPVATTTGQKTHAGFRPRTQAVLDAIGGLVTDSGKICDGYPAVLRQTLRAKADELKEFNNVAPENRTKTLRRELETLAGAGRISWDEEWVWHLGVARRGMDFTPGQDDPPPAAAPKQPEAPAPEQQLEPKQPKAAPKLWTLSEEDEVQLAVLAAGGTVQCGGETPSKDNLQQLGKIIAAMQALPRAKGKAVLQIVGAKSLLAVPPSKYDEALETIAKVGGGL